MKLRANRMKHYIADAGYWIDLIAPRDELRYRATTLPRD